MNRIVLLCGATVVVMMLLSCTRQLEQLVDQPSIAFRPSSTVPVVGSPTQTSLSPSSPSTPFIPPTVTETLLPAPLPTAGYFPTYPTKQALLDYISRGYHSDFEFFLADGINRNSKLVLYSDGQIILRRDSRHLQTRMTVDEVKQLFSTLESLGFFTIESNQKEDETDRLYDFGGKFEEVEGFDGSSFCILAKGIMVRTLCIYEPYLDYLIPEMRTILDFIEGYEPEELVPYFPDRILLQLNPGRNLDDPNLNQEAIPWINSSLSLELSCQERCQQVFYLEGDLAKEIYSDCGISGCVYSQNGKEYTVYVRPVLPHEVLTNIAE